MANHEHIEASFSQRDLAITLNLPHGNGLLKALRHELAHYVIAMSSPQTVRLSFHWMSFCGAVMKFLNYSDYKNIKVGLPLRKFIGEDNLPKDFSEHLDLANIYKNYIESENIVFSFFHPETFDNCLQAVSDVKIDPSEPASLSIGSNNGNFIVPVGRHLIEEQFIALFDSFASETDLASNSFAELINADFPEHPLDFIEKFSLSVAISRVFDSKVSSGTARRHIFTILTIYILSLIMDDDILKRKEYAIFDSSYNSAGKYLPKIMKSVEKVGTYKDGRVDEYANKLMLDSFGVCLTDYFDNFWNFLANSKARFENVRKENNMLVNLATVAIHFVTYWRNDLEGLFLAPLEVLENAPWAELISPVFIERDGYLDKYLADFSAIPKPLLYYFITSKSMYYLLWLRKLTCVLVENHNQESCPYQESCNDWVHEDDSDVAVFPDCPHKGILKSWYGNLDKFYSMPS